MKFEELTIHTTTPGSELVGGVLLASGVSCFVTEDYNDLVQVIEEKSIPFDYIEEDLLRDPGDVRVKVYLPHNEQGRLQKAEILAGLEKLRRESDVDAGTLQTDFSEVDEEDWANNWKQYFHPLPIGDRFVVKPTWETYEGDDRVVLEIDPASSFGSGQHETTSLCLEELESLPLEGASVLDMGCGSGILGIGAALLGASDVVCVDIEQIAADTAAKNARINRIPDGVLKTYCGNVLTDPSLCDAVLGAERYDVILANIVADVIVAMLPLFQRALKPGGTLLCSGILSTRREEVLSAARELGFSVRASREKNDWAVLVCGK